MLSRGWPVEGVKNFAGDRTDKFSARPLFWDSTACQPSNPVSLIRVAMIKPTYPLHAALQPSSNSSCLRTCGFKPTSNWSVFKSLVQREREPQAMSLKTDLSAKYISILLRASADSPWVMTVIDTVMVFLQQLLSEPSGCKPPHLLSEYYNH